MKIEFKGFSATIQEIVDFITAIIAEILGFIAEGEGWTEEATDDVAKF